MSLAEQVDPQVKIIAFVGPSAAGKTRMVQTLRAADKRFEQMLSITTRARRPTDLEGEYRHIDISLFHTWAHQDRFQWITGLHENRYGTLRVSIDQALTNQWATVMHLEPLCAPRLWERAKDNLKLFFLTAPQATLERRLRERDKGQKEEYYQKRINECLLWEKQARNSGLSYTFIANDDNRFDEAYEEVVQHLLSPSLAPMNA